MTNTCRKLERTLSGMILYLLETHFPIITTCQAHEHLNSTRLLLPSSTRLLLPVRYVYFNSFISALKVVEGRRSVSIALKSHGFSVSFDFHVHENEAGGPQVTDIFHLQMHEIKRHKHLTISFHLVVVIFMAQVVCVMCYSQ